ncbi:hypothetical protein [Kushneria indalinina]|uniref:Outer membrane protein n=1 Tax=Kushneria indalinina DSM 14324 TaxID=1122140 RepID=A0A3D9DX60_9GAMM|nr:hypothetical protein [Kushneria indalinina]REC95281.1 hypothetical protein C8D72_2117 [Kushneria indalinina DSM 14324]
MRRIATAVITGSLLLVTSAAAMADDHWSVAGSAGTTGLGANVSWRFHDHFALTAGYSGYNYDDLEHTNGDVTYKGEVDMDIYSLKLDIYPWVNSGFFISAGAVKPDVQLKAVGRYTGDGALEDFGISGDAGNARLNGRAKLSDNVEPYLGIGWRNSSKQGLGFYAEAGAFWIDPSVSLTPRGDIFDSSVTGPAARAAVDQEVRNQEDDLRSDLNKYNVYPVAVIGIEYTF